VVQFAVVLKESEWTVFEDGLVIARGLSRSKAIKLAAQFAFEAEEAKEDVQILVQNYTGEVRARYSGTN
jgi:hypothetical protein